MSQPLALAPERVLVVDDDPDIARFVELGLSLEGFAVQVAPDGERALELARARVPDLVVLDLILPGVDGIEVLRRLRADSLTGAVAVIMLTACGGSPDKVLGLDAGANDYLAKPFDLTELAARVRATLRVRRELRELSPLTGLPGNTRILREIDRRMRIGEPFAVCYCDIDGFKAVNDVYGFARGDEFIVTLARQLVATVRPADPPVFLGHVGGDDFVLICTPDQVRPLTDLAVTRFEESADELYDPDHRQLGYLSVRDRRGNSADVGLVTVSIGVAMSSRRVYHDPRELVADASEMKKVAKSQPGSYVAVDRRRV